MILALGAMSFEDRSEKEKLDMFVSAFEKTKMARWIRLRKDEV